ncbi:hypothetical protein FKR81_20680 [Lentzea tibetensis]|uniref:Peptidase M15B domain-containing protein n=1 Tax=Lentzea tibetensis TaxID=2591470 RepID=A0A563ETY6_9PSEU|nr:D-alanyl-D-alanine carboxypeptidase family protein [Lentzea tibetensis]TWP50584.1 hypothetical protein FKR81_20680 [Lentzea tibetensis]
MPTLSATQIAQHAYNAGFRGQALTTAVAIALAESGGRTAVKGDTTITDQKWGPSVGLWQIRSLHADRGTGRERDELANTSPAVNARHAWTASHHGTYWRPWSVYLNGSYRQYLDTASEATRKVHSGQKDTKAEHRPRHKAGRGPDRIVLDLHELRGLQAFFADCSDRVGQVRRRLAGAEHDLAPALAVLADPALASLIKQSFQFLASPEALPRTEERLDWHAGFAAKVRRLAEAADGEDNRWTRGDAMRFVTKADGRLDRAERAVLEALITGTIVRRRSDLGAHVRQDHHPAGDSTPPKADVGGLRNGHVQPSKLTSVGDGEKMLAPVARQFRRMDAAARTAGIDLHVESGYRGYAEQSALYQKYLAGKGNLAAPPGRSDHGLGLSADIVTSQNPKVLVWLRANAGKFGFVNDVPSENWHWTYRNH